MKIIACQIYFRRVEKKEKEIVGIDVKKFFEDICNFSKQERTSKTDQYSPTLVVIKKKMPNEKLSLSFYKYKGGEKPYIEDENGDLTQLEDTLVELTNAYLDDTNNLLYVQYNYNGIKIKKIEEYLNEFINDDSIKLCIEPLYKEFIINTIYNTNITKEIEIEFNKNIFSYENEECNLFTPISTFIMKANDSIKNNLKLSLKSNKGERFEGEVVRGLIENIENISEIENIFISYEDKNKKIKRKKINGSKEELSFSILEERRNLGWEYIIDNIYRKYTLIETEAIEIARNTLKKMKKFEGELILKKVN